MDKEIQVKGEFHDCTMKNDLVCLLALLLAYKNGHGQLCRALVVAGANLSICNYDCFSIFTTPAASKALLVNILGKITKMNFTVMNCTIFLDTIPREPPWGESETCLECAGRFTLTNRKHHW